MKTHPVYARTTFLTSAAKISQLPADIGAEVVFAGRSNAGKSSALNMLTHVKRLARTSKTPGRTQLINFFQLDEDHRLVDLPGYGYAKVPEEIQQRWQHTLSRYLEERKSLKGIILLMDIRHPFKPLDIQTIEWMISHNRPIHILLTKADKLRRGAALNTLQQAKKMAEQFNGAITLQLFSSFDGTGVEEAQTKLDTWLFP